MRRTASAGIGTLVLALLPALALPATAVTGDAGGPPWEEIPGQQGRVTHQTLASTLEEDCFEISIPRAANATAVRAVVPDRYGLLSTGTDTTRIQIWNFTCRHFSVDGKHHDAATQVSMGAVQLASRDAVAVPTATWYLLWFTTDNPVLAARYSQVGLPASYAPDSTSSASDLTQTPYTVSFAVGGDDALTMSSEATAAPVPAPATSSLRLFHEASKVGEVLLAISNREIAGTAAAIRADLTHLTTLVPLIAQPRLLTIGTAAQGTTFLNGSVRGSWSSTLSHVD